MDAGKPWTEEEDNRLSRQFDEGRRLAELAKNHGRTRNAISARLLLLGKTHASAAL